MIRKYTIRIIVIIVAVVAGFIFLLRGCLAKYDERSAVTPALVFEKENKAVVFTIVKYAKTTSYKSDGGSTYKRMNTNYYIQTNDMITGEVINSKKIKHSSDIKFHPVTVMGPGNGKAWVFMGELLAFDPFTLEKFADNEIIEAKNPQLKGKIPNEKRYYVYNDATNDIAITATDGITYLLSTTNLQATAVDEDEITKSPAEAAFAVLKKTEEALDEKYKNHYERYRMYNKMYSDKKISYAAYLDSGRNFNRVQDEISEKRKNIREEMSGLEHSKYAGRDRQRAIDDLKSGSKSYTSICTTVDTFNGKWYGLLNNADLGKDETMFRYRNVQKETDRNKLYIAAVSLKDSSAKFPEISIATPEKLHDAVYLQGGFLLNRSTALPIHLQNSNAFIVCYREKVGSTGNIILARVDLTGNTTWTFDTKLKEFADWIVTGNRLLILGNDNKQLSSSDVNLLISIDLKTGKAVMHDYFTNKMRKE